MEQCLVLCTGDQFRCKARISVVPLFDCGIDDLSRLESSVNSCHIILYADDILLLSPSLTRLQHLLHKCEVELAWLDMSILANLHVYVLDRAMMLFVPRLLVQLAILYHGLLRSDI